MKSLWENTAKLPRFEKLDGDIKTDVLIIGGGITGILCAYFMQAAGIPYVLAEADVIGGGVTSGTTAKITSQHGLIYNKLIHRFGKETAGKYLKANRDSVEKYMEICRNIDCDFVESPSYVYSRCDRRILEEEVEALEILGFSASLSDDVPLPFPTVGAVKFERQANFHPLKFMSALSEGLRIYENTMVRKLEGNVAVTDSGRITADKIIIAAHFPFLNKHGGYFMKMYQERSYVIAVSGAADLDGMYVDEAKSGMSFRNYKDLLIIGGGSRRTGKKGANWRDLSDFARKYYPNSEEKYRFAAQDCITLDGIPYIGPYFAGSNSIYVATGFNKWGMTSSMNAAMILCDMVRGIKNPYEDIFSPSRSMMHPELAVNLFESAVNLLTPSKKRCSHLGCALKWNPHEGTWDCPCHGSRFTKEGKLICDPAMRDIPPSRY